MRALTFAMSLLLTLSLGVAHAANQQQIDATLHTAHTQYQAKQPAEALKHLDQALAQSTALPAYQARIQYFRARCLLDLHRPDEAREALERFIGLSTDADDKRRGRTRLAKVLRRFYGSMRVQCTDGARRVAIAGVPGKPRRCPAQWDGLKPGKYVLHLTGRGAPKTRAIELFAGQRLTHDLNKNTQSRSTIKAPTPARFGWGLFGRAGLSLPGATLPAPASVTQGLTAEAGAWANLLWPVGPLALGLRLEFGYRFWSAEVAHEGVDARAETVTTHGLSLPVLAELELPWALALRVGPAATFVAQAESGGAELSTTPLGLMAVAGLAWRLPLKGLNLRTNLRYAHALTGVFEHTTLRRHQAQLGLEWGW
jgi:tetratricopeptide (TPR) repeat protein